MPSSIGKVRAQIMHRIAVGIEPVFLIVEQWIEDVTNELRVGVKIEWQGWEDALID